MMCDSCLRGINLQRKTQAVLSDLFSKFVEEAKAHVGEVTVQDGTKFTIIEPRLQYVLDCH